MLRAVEPEPPLAAEEQSQTQQANMNAWIKPVSLKHLPDGLRRRCFPQINTEITQETKDEESKTIFKFTPIQRIMTIIYKTFDYADKRRKA